MLIKYGFWKPFRNFITKTQIKKINSKNKLTKI